MAIADEIAQRGHDLDDAFSSGAMEFDDFKNYLTVKKMKGLLGIVETVNMDLTSMGEKNRRFVDEKELKNSRTVSAIVSYFINDVINNSQRKLYINLRNISENVVDFEYGNHEVIKEEFDMITNENLKELSTEDAAEYKEKRRVLVRTICDFISGMTDTYAINEYNRIIK